MSNRSITGPLKWHGGKHYLAAKIVALMPKHIHYVEPYAGGLSVLLAKNPEGVSEVVNDLNSDLTQFWRVLQDPADFASFARLMSAVPFSQVEWEESDEVPRPGYSGVVAAAANFFIRCRQSHSGRFKDFAAVTRSRVRRGMNEQVSAWLNCVEGLPEVHGRLKRVLILNKPAIEVIWSEDGPDTLFYLDPPYLHSTRATTGEYDHEMTEEQHWELLNELPGIKGKFLLSGYRSTLYDETARLMDWNRVDIDAPNNAAGGKKKRRMTECVWMNYDPSSVKPRPEAPPRSDVAS